MIPTTPGIYPNVPMEDYLAAPAASAGLIKALTNRCPAAARAESWLNPNRPRTNADATDGSDIGEICHAIVLEGRTDSIVEINPADHPAEKGGGIPTGWTNKSIRAARDAARAVGKIPILTARMAEVNAIVDAVSQYIASLENSPDTLAQKVCEAFKPHGGDSEVTILWQDGRTLCRMRPDRLAVDLRLIVDLKFTSLSAEPEQWGRSQLMRMDYATSAAWYKRGAQATFGRGFEYVFLVTEITPPYLSSLIGVDPAWAAMGAAKVDRGIREWANCVSDNSFPGYPLRVCYPELPTWALRDWEDELTDAQPVEYASQP